MSRSELPIGIFDSGVGGLTVARAVHHLLPHEDIVYLGDTARLPYGDKSRETIERYAREDLAFLHSVEVKAAVVACNTATAYALDALCSANDLPVLGVVEPGVQAALNATRNGHIGIIGTAGTIGSGAYQNALRSRRKDVQLTVMPTPLLVPLIEENWLPHEATTLILREYLRPLQEAQIDTLVLACTHYPLAKPQLAGILSSAVTLVDSAENMALALRQKLEATNLLRTSRESNSENGKEPEGRVEVNVTDLSPQFEDLARRFLGNGLRKLQKVTLPES